MAPTRATFNCPRCGEALPVGVSRCDACGAYIAAPASHAAERAPARPRPAVRGGGYESAGRMSSFAWLMLVVGLLVGGAVGYALRSGSGVDTGQTGPSDLMSGGGAMGGGGGGMGAAGAPGGQGMGMPPEVAQALQQYRAKLAENPKDLEANIGIANLLFDSAQWQKATEHYEKALEIDPKNPDVRVDMAIAYHNLGDNARARKEMERVTREQPGHVNAWFNLGVVAGTMGDKKASIRAWEEYLKLDPHGARAPGIRDEIKRMKETP